LKREAGGRESPNRSGPRKWGAGTQGYKFERRIKRRHKTLFLNAQKWAADTYNLKTRCRGRKKKNASPVKSCIMITCGVSHGRKGMV